MQGDQRGRPRKARYTERNDACAHSNQANHRTPAAREISRACTQSPVARGGVHKFSRGRINGRLMIEIGELGVFDYPSPSSEQNSLHICIPLPQGAPLSRESRASQELARGDAEDAEIENCTMRQ